VSISKRDNNYINKACTRTPSRRATDARKAELTEAFQIFKQIKFNIVG
jgi:hypothetical protein